MSRLRQRLGWKLFLSYIVIIVVGMLTMAIAVEVQTPRAMARHINSMGDIRQREPMSQHAPMSENLLTNITQAMREVLVIASGIAMVAALAVSSYVTRRIIIPIEKMRLASAQIATGDYAERVPVVSDDELGAMAESFNSMAGALEETETRRRQLIGDVAHELRTPLTNIRSVLEGVVDGVFDNKSSAVIDVQDEVRRLQRLVRDLEQLSKAEAGQLSMEKVAVDAAEFIHAAAERLAWQYEDKTVTLKIELPHELPVVLADSGRMTQVMLNLLGNALQYTPAGGEVVVSAEKTPTTLKIHVRDTGIGLAPDQLVHIFERFYRADKSRSRASGGSGIGLTISKHIVEAHAGTLSATSMGSGEGSCFTVMLPIFEAD